jgi:hypothetical protein
MGHRKKKKEEKKKVILGEDIDLVKISGRGVAVIW